MTLLEKSMFFIPNRLYVHENELYVSFNIAVIPEDMDVTSMTLYIPLPAGSKDAHLQLHEIGAAWDVQSVQHIRPAYSPASSMVDLPSDAKQASFALEHVAYPWRFHSLDNHGVYVRVQSVDPVLLSDEQPPYLIVDTV